MEMWWGPQKVLRVSGSFNVSCATRQNLMAKNIQTAKNSMIRRTLK